MAPPTARPLPARRNPFLTDDIPNYTDLVSRRRLGQTQLTARMVAAPPGASVDPAALGVFDYAHLRAPIPKGIVSGIFKSSPNSYFLMRRSHDGYVSATGMFKATFPYAMAEEEEAERRYIKSLSTTSPEETAGNVWIPPESALVLAEEYGVSPWIRALLDPADIAVSTTNSESSPAKRINAPPKFFPSATGSSLVPPTPTSIRRNRRSASPSKSASRRAIASPRKRSTRQTASQADASEAPSSSSSGRKTSLTNGDIPVLAPTKAEDVKVESTEKEPASTLETVEEEPKVKVKIDQDVESDKVGGEVRRTKVGVEVPFSAGIQGPEDAAKMIEEAKAMVEAAKADKAGSTPKSAKGKRKAEDFDADNDAEDGEGGESGSALQPRAKKVKTEVELRKQRVKKRALLGITVTLAAGALFPYAMNFL
ncbi:Bouquet formation protein 4 [Cytospora mali]|uniref:Bouquet formation protein 4 n=1 Tax=Cytospora mali TaxID=578113 RepID=A0A194VV39_CYTMA|nr:Bouquet formation protein 4 [Valsa mali]